VSPCTPRWLSKAWRAAGALGQGRGSAAHRQFQAARRLQQNRAVVCRRARPRRDHLFQREPCAGSRLRSSGCGRESRHRDALECAPGEGKRHPGVGSGDRHRRPSQRGAQSQGRRTGRRNSATWSFHPYDDRDIIAGQGSCGLEILADRPEVDLVLAPVGGGGLLSGVAAAVKLTRPGVRVIGVEPELASDAAESFKAGSIVSFTGEQSADRGRWFKNAERRRVEFCSHAGLCRRHCDRHRS
jgi:hypothetical protein